MTRVWAVLAVGYLLGKFAVDVGVDGALTDPSSGWLAIPLIAAVQALALVAMTRRREPDSGESR